MYRFTSKNKYKHSGKRRRVIVHINDYFDLKSRNIFSGEKALAVIFSTKVSSC